MITHIPYQATITFIRSGEPGIIMRETFRCEREHPAAKWLEVLADYCADSTWLQVIEIITIQYWFNVTEEVLDEAHYAGRHRS